MRGSVSFATVSRPALGPTELPVQGVPTAVSLGLKRPGPEATHSPPALSSKVKNAWSYNFTPPYVSTGSASPLPGYMTDQLSVHSESLVKPAYARHPNCHSFINRLFWKAEKELWPYGLATGLGAKLCSQLPFN